MKKGELFLILLVTVSFSCVDEPPIEKYTISTTASPAEGGTVYISPGELDSFDEGQRVALIPKANDYWVFQNWEGDVSGTDDPYFLEMNSSISVTAVFVKREYPLSLKVIGEGTVKETIVANPSGREYLFGTTVELTPMPKEGWVFESWTDGISVANESPIRIIIEKAKTVTVKFVPKPQGDPNFYMAENGITCKCENVISGSKGFINGTEYEAVSNEFLRQRVRDEVDMTKLCTSLVTDMSALFTVDLELWEWNPYAVSFNQPIGNWDVSNVTNMSEMFSYSTFNQPLENWDVSNVENMDYMFKENYDFNQDLSTWCVVNISKPPKDFSTGSFIKPKPIWGTCPD